MTSLGEQTWFRSRSRTLEGWVHRPDDGRVVGAVVIAGPFAHEALVAYRAIRVLAVEAARRGFVAVRFSWSGTGDSEPAPGDVALAAAWQEDLAATVELARATSGIEAVDAIGVRFGAAVVDASDVPFRTRVLWEPLGGRAFLRMQSSLLKMHLPPEFPRARQGVELCGETLGEEDATSVRALPDPRAHTARHAARVVVEDDPQTSAHLFGGSPQDARVPLPSLALLLDALDPSPASALPEWSPERELISEDPATGRRLRQTFVDVGPHRLPGIITEPADGPTAASAAMFIPFANEPKGVDRVGRATSMRLGGGGIPTLRADRRGVGDAADPRDLAEVPTFTHDAVDDVAQFASWLAERTALPVVGIGLCSGAWLVARSASRTRLERVVLVNNQAWSTSLRYWDRQARIFSGLRDNAVIDADARLRLASTARPGLRRRIKLALRFRAPYQLRYRIYAPAGRDEIAQTLLGAIPARTSVSLLLGPTGDQRIWEAARGADSVRRLVRRGHRIEVAYDERTDHSLMSEVGFASYLELLDRDFGLGASDELTATPGHRGDGSAESRAG